MNREEWKKKILERIESAAGERRLLYYDELLVLSGDGNPDRPELYEILGEINNERQDGLKPSAIVVSKEMGMPGAGFYREFMPEAGTNVFKFFAGEAKKVFQHYAPDAPKNYGVLIDADNVASKNVADFLRKQSRFPIVLRACGIADKWEWGIKLINESFSQCDPQYYSVPAPAGTKKHQKQHDAADFFLSMTGAVMMEKTYDKRLLDEIYIMSGDKDFAYLRKFINGYRVDVLCFNNRMEKVPCAGKGKKRII